MSDEPYSLVEPFCGSAALSLHLCGATRSLMPYQGSKWKARRSLRAVAVSRGFEGPPDYLCLTDIGPWGRAIGAVLHPLIRPELIARLSELAEEDPRSVYLHFHLAPVPSNVVEFAAQFLFLQRLAFSGKAVSSAGGRWNSPGFNRTSAYGTPATARFGKVSPMVPSLIRTLESYEKLSRALSFSHQGPAFRPRNMSGPKAHRLLVYIDPPYRGVTSYPDGSMDRDGVIALAREWFDVGATVIISEQEPLMIPRWEHRRLTAPGTGKSPFRGTVAEYLTISPR